MMRNQLRWATLAGVLCAASAGADELAGRVFLPDGRPAVGAKIIARNIGPRFPPRRPGDDVTTVTDEMGNFAATVTPIVLVAADGRWNRPYILIDAPGCALCFMSMTEAVKTQSVNGIAGRYGAVVRLQPAFTFQGMVVGPDRKPVPGARVAVIRGTMNFVESSPLNIAGLISTPQLVTQSGADGKFALRGLTGPAPEKADGYLSIHSSSEISAVATIRGNLWAGTGYVSAPLTPQGIKPDAPRKVVLQPAVTFSGHLLDAVTGKPLPNVEVSVSNGSPALVSSVRSGVDGSFQVAALAPAHLRLTQFGERAPDGRGNWWPNRVSTEVSRVEEIVGPQRLQNLVFRLPPIAIINGHFVDEDTGEAPLTQDDVSATVETTTRDGWRYSPRPSFDYSRDGKFSLAVPAGPLKIAAGVRKEYPHAYSSEPQTWLAPPAGLPDAVLKVHRNPGFFVRLRPRDEKYPLPFGRYEVHWRRADGVQEIKEMQDEPGGHYWFRAAKNWGEALEMRILRDKAEIVPWTRIVADSKQWPLVVTPR